MIWLVIGVAVLILLLLGLSALSRASVSTIRMLLTGIAAASGLLIVVLLVIAGQGPRIMAAIALIAPYLWRRWQVSGMAGFTPGGGASGAGARPGPEPGAAPPPPRRGKTGMTQQEAYDILGLPPGARKAEILEAHRRLMRMAHPDAGGSDWLAARINQARDTLLG